jgi:hypothetical protein
MGRRRWIQHPDTLELIPADEFVDPHPLACDTGVLWNDRQYQDANDSRFASRTQHREYMKKNNLAAADDFKGEWKEAANRRADFFTKGSDPSRIHDVARAFAELNDKRR